MQHRDWKTIARSTKGGARPGGPVKFGWMEIGAALVWGSALFFAAMAVLG
ncbi:hypothetical protein [Magnetospira sp. QH-2]|nr:hypothetical protein [Magnetospira sp. QH-2]